MQSSTALLAAVVFAAFIVQPGAGQRPPVLLPDDEVENIAITLVISDPDRNAEPEFYEGYGLLFDVDARDEGPICLDRQTGVIRSTFTGLDTSPDRRCISLGELRTIVWGATK